MFGSKDRKIIELEVAAAVWQATASSHRGHITNLQAEVIALKSQVGKLKYKKLRDYTVTLEDGTSIVFRADKLCHRRDGAVAVFWIDDVEIGCASGYRHVTSVPVVPGL